MQILLTALNARYIHASFGLRYLMANLGDLAPQAEIVEFDLNRRALEIAENLLNRQPRIVALGVYIWNVTLATELISLLKRIQPDLKIILGGPEVSYETAEQEIVRMADCTITGEADLTFPRICRELLSGRDVPRVIAAPLPQFTSIQLPYKYYSAEDLAHRITYVEASRGCPFSCEFCLSSLDIPVRAVPVEAFLDEMKALLERGAQHLKFVDRTFNLNARVGSAILEFCLSQWKPGRYFHFEMIPDRLPDALREVIVRFPPGALQFEVGIQTFNPDVAANISRRNDYAKVEANLTWLRDHTGVHVHADLIAGLPGETVESFATGFDRLAALRPQEIQVGILKRLRGTPIIRHDTTYRMVYSGLPPYELLSTADMTFAQLQAIRRFARWHDLIANSGNFPTVTATIFASQPSAYAAFSALSEWLHQRTGKTDGIALLRLAEMLFTYLTEPLKLSAPEAAIMVWGDYTRSGRTERPPALISQHMAPIEPRQAPTRPQSLLKRQARHG